VWSNVPYRTVPNVQGCNSLNVYDCAYRSSHHSNHEALHQTHDHPTTHHDGCCIVSAQNPIRSRLRLRPSCLVIQPTSPATLHGADPATGHVTSRGITGATVVAAATAGISSPAQLTAAADQAHPCTATHVRRPTATESDGPPNESALALL